MFVLADPPQSCPSADSGSQAAQNGECEKRPFSPFLADFAGCRRRKAGRPKVGHFNFDEKRRFTDIQKINFLFVVCLKRRI